MQLSGSFSWSFSPYVVIANQVPHMVILILIICFICREAPSSSTSNSQPNPKRSNKENQNFNKNFLTLALPSPTSSCPPSNFKSPSSFLASHNQEYPHLESQSFQVWANPETFVKYFRNLLLKFWIKMTWVKKKFKAPDHAVLNYQIRHLFVIYCWWP